MKFIPFAFLLLIVSCAHLQKKTDEKTVETENTNETPKILAECQKELNNAYDNAAIDEYYKEIYKIGKLVVEEDGKMISITENLFSQEEDKDLFYFVVFTKSMNGADGFYSEALGVSALKFLKEYPQRFAAYFNCSTEKLDDNDIYNWAFFIKSEIAISNEGNEAQALEELGQFLTENVKDGKSEEKAFIQQFIKRLDN